MARLAWPGLSGSLLDEARAKNPRAKNPRAKNPRAKNPSRSRASLTVIRLQIVADDLRVGRINWRPEHVDHLGQFRIPPSRIEKCRIHRNVIEGVAGGAIGLDLVGPRGLLELNGLFAGRGRHRD